MATRFYKLLEPLYIRDILTLELSCRVIHYRVHLFCIQNLPLLKDGFSSLFDYSSSMYCSSYLWANQAQCSQHALFHPHISRLYSLDLLQRMKITIYSEIANHLWVIDMTGQNAQFIAFMELPSTTKCFKLLLFPTYCKTTNFCVRYIYASQVQVTWICTT